ncbi:P-loop containing nucleoside triphosphate hydrolase protein, partial [Mycena galopus ATCC 62051]
MQETEESPRISILGPGGMGKTSLARAILHHPQVTTRFGQHRFFVACDSVMSKNELVALVGSHLRLKSVTHTRQLIQYFASSPPCLLVIDNLETLWEPIESRTMIEEFLSLLTGVHHLALIITMRGAERPAKVRWTRPFLIPLQPLGQDAARKILVDIADSDHDSRDIDKVLLLTDNMPLAINLIAHLVDLEGCTNVLAGWEEEHTSSISRGHDKGSNLDLSIALSLSSPRLTSSSHAQDLLSLLAILPDGLSNTELLNCNLPIVDILHCKTILISTSLAYSDAQKRLRSWVPIREYMQSTHPP